MGNEAQNTVFCSLLWISVEFFLNLAIFKLLTHIDLDMSVFVYTKLDAITLLTLPAH